MSKIIGNVVGTNMSVDRIADRIGAGVVYNVNIEPSGKIYDTFFNISNAFHSGKMVILTDNSEVETTIYICTGAGSTRSGQNVLWFSSMQGDPETAGGCTVMIRGLWMATNDSCLLMPAETYNLSDMGGGGGSVELDTTLSVAGKAADAKAVGDAIGNIAAAFDELHAYAQALVGGGNA